MGKALKIVFYVLVIALLFLWAMTVAEKCKDKKLNADQTEEVTDDLLEENFSDDIGDLTDLSDDDAVDDLTDDADDLKSDDSQDSETSFEDLSTQETTEDLSDLTAPVVEEKPRVQKPSPKPAQSAAGGQYLLVAGNYSVHSNAQQMISKLKRMGYNSAEIVQFDNSNFSTAVAARYDDYDKATAAKGKLVSRGIDCYVHKQKF